MPETSSSIIQLQSNWFQLHDLDRARAVAAIRRSGTSIRQIARDLKFSPSLLRHLLLALKAPAEDQELARHNQISTNELVRRARAANAQRAERRREVVVRERDKAGRKGADVICNWLVEEQISGPDGERILEEVRRKLSGMEQAGLKPIAPKPISLSTTQIIQGCKPPELTDNSIDILAWYTRWLYTWAYWAFPDNQVLWTALDGALERQGKR